jgi:hypothetical protein
MPSPITPIVHPSGMPLEPDLAVSRVEHRIHARPARWIRASGFSLYEGHGRGSKRIGRRWLTTICPERE